MSTTTEILRQVPVPRMVRVRQHFDRTQVDDVAGEVRRQLLQEKFISRIRPEMSIAITCGSRGIANYPLVIREIVRICQEAGAKPFIIPAMGSHAGAVAEGQRRMCESLGVTEEYCGCPLRASMETVQIGTTDDGIPVHIDRLASEADGIIICNRIKAHTVLYGPYESGLMKMLAIGLGKQYGAQIIHQLGWLNMTKSIERFGNAIMDNANILFGVGLLENAYDQTYKVAALLPNEIREQEPELLSEAKSKMARLLPGEADILIVDRMGKDISGDGMDPNITGKFSKFYKGKPNFICQLLVVLDLTDATHGNFIGVEAANVTTERFMRKCSIEETYPNALSSCSALSTPMYLPSDKEAIQCAIKITGGVALDKMRIIRIQDTLHISEILVSECMVDEIRKHPDMEIVGAPEPWAFDENGNLW